MQAVFRLDAAMDVRRLKAKPERGRSASVHRDERDRDMRVQAEGVVWGGFRMLINVNVEVPDGIDECRHCHSITWLYYECANYRQRYPGHLNISYCLLFGQVLSLSAETMRPLKCEACLNATRVEE